MKKKSTIFAFVAVLCIAAALYFMQRETKELYADGDEYLTDDEGTEPEPEPKPRRARKEIVKQPTDENTEQPTVAEGDTNE